MRKAFLLIVAVTAILTIACKRNQYKVDVSGSSVKLEIKRLEKDLFTLNPENIASDVPSLKTKYGGFLQLFSYVLKTGDINDPSFGDFMIRFCTDKQNNEVYAYTIKIFPNVNSIESGLSDAFSHYRHYFPSKPIPSVYTCISGFNNSIITGDSVLGIGLDRYLGAACQYYPRLNIYKYISDNMTPANIVTDCMYAWASSEWDFASLRYPADNVLSEIIHYGKLKYFEKCMLPGTGNNLLFGFSPGQMKFCRNNEREMWQYLVEKNLLFSTDQLTIRKLIVEAPFTGFFTEESPGRAAVWLGFRIVESYMQKNRNVSLEDLMKNSDFQMILEKSKYNPK